MRLRPSFWYLVSLLCVVGAWLFWQQGNRWAAERNNAASATPPTSAPATAATNHVKAAEDAGHASAASTNRMLFRLSNTKKSITELSGDRRAILLENAFIDTSAKLDLKIPSHLQAAGDPGAYIVQARGSIDAAFRAVLAAAGAQIISYIPNNAYLVRLTAGGAGALAGDVQVQAVLPYEPYYKVQSSLLGLAVNQDPLPPGTYLTLGLFGDTAAATEAQIKALGGIVLSQDRSPFGQMVRVSPPTDWISLVNLPGVQIVEPAYLRKTANDLARPTLGVSTDTVTTTNWLNLSGSNVLVEVNDSGIDPTHPDLTGRVTGDFALSLQDTDGHGTHVAGIIAGNGFESTTVTNAQGSINLGTNGQYRGKAPLARLFSVGFLGVNDTNVFVTDSYLQETPARTNALISNNSWVNAGDNQYDLSAASYDAAVRDALPRVTGPQPVLFVFAAGNYGNSDSADGQQGSADTIASPGTAKDVITVGALEQLRNLTNIVTALDGTSNTVWAADTDSSDQVAYYSSRGNVGIQTEGAFGRFKPDVVAPGNFVISTRSTMWDQVAYYSPTNYHDKSYLNQVVTSNAYMFGGASIPQNAVGVTIRILPNALSPVPFPTNLLIYASAFGNPDPTDPQTYDLVTSNNLVSIPPNTGGLITDITSLEDYGLAFAVGDSTNTPVNFDVFVQVITTNDFGNELGVLSNLNNSISGSAPYYYRYESGTSIAAPAVSGVLACMQDFFTNTLRTTPSPALLKAMLINGARVAGGYRYAVTNTLNLQGWGVPKLYNSIPAALTNAVVGTNGTPMFFVDQSPTNALATGDSRTYAVKVTSGAQSQPLRITLAWTDPPGNPAAAIKLVNNLDVVVTNTDTGQIFYANNFTPSGSPPFSAPAATNAPPVQDYVNNVKNIFIPPTLATNYTVTVIGRSVNVNAVTLEQTNVVQDFALVISSGDGSNTNGISVAPATPAPVSAISPNITYVVSTNGIYFDQLAGASAPLLSTNGIGFGGASSYGTNALDQIGQTNQWHFYVVTNTFAMTNANFTNAAFITFIPNTLAIPREGVFAGSDANSTRPEADIDMYVAGPNDVNASGLTNLSPSVISNCVYGNLGDAASLTRGGTEFVAYSNSAAGNVYYVGVQSQDQTAAQYGFIAVFSDKPFSQNTPNGQIVNGVPLPINIPDGNNAHPGVTYVFGLALTPMEIDRVIVTNTFTHQLFGDLVGALSHGGAYDVLNSHDGLGAVVNTNLVYDDSGRGDIIGSRSSDGPGSLRNFQGTQAVGPWLLNVVDDNINNTGSISGFQMLIQPHQDPRKGLTVTLGAGQWFYTYIDVPAGYYNLTVLATNISAVPDPTAPIDLLVKEGQQPTLADTNYFVMLTNGVPPGNFVSVGPPLTPDRYFIGLFNPGTTSQNVYLIANLAFDPNALTTVDYASTDTPVPILDDAVMTDSIFVTNTDTIQGFNVGLRVDHPRISDLVFTLIRPDGTRYLLMENRGGTTTNGCGVTVVTTNILNASANGGPNATTNFFDTGQASCSILINYNMFTVPDEMTVYYSTNLTPANLITNFVVSGAGQLTVVYPPPTAVVSSTYITVVMNATNVQPQTLWTYTVGSVQTNYYYLKFAEGTNVTRTATNMAAIPIKFAPVPFVPDVSLTSAFADNFDAYALGTYSITSFGGGWTVLTNQVAITNNPPANSLPNFLALQNGAISNNLPTVSGRQYVLTYELGTTASDSAGPVTNANWRLASITFTASGTNGTSLVLDASGGAYATNTLIKTAFDTNALFDDFVLTELPQNNLVYQPEQDISDIIGTSAFGNWQLEILDDRAGATNPAPQLVSWQLEFTFANTNFVPLADVTFPILTNGVPATNSTGIPPGGVVYYQVNVPLNADAATNSLLFADAPLNVWWSTNFPPTVGDANDFLLFSGTSGGSTLVTNSSPAIIPGTTYYLGVQNTNSVTVTNYAVEVTFHLTGQGAPFVFTQPAQAVTGTNAQLNGMATPNGFAATAWFQWGTNTSYGSNTPPVNVGSGFNVVYTNAVISGLVTNTAYHFRMVVSNAFAVTYGFDQVLDEANVVAWGADYVGQINVPLGLSNVVAIAGAYDHSLALKNNGRVVAWGDNNFGQANVPAGLSNVLAIAGGQYYSMALKSNGTVVAWGPTLLSQTNVPVGLSNVVTIAGGTYSSLALKNDGSVVAWGAPFFNLTNVPANVSNTVAVAGGTYHSLALKNDGTVVAWGDNSSGQTNVPPGLTNVVAIAAGGYHSLALLTNGTVVAWGDNSAGQTNVPAGLINVVAIAAGGFHSLALKNNGSVVAWGDPSAGQTSLPGGLTNFVAITAGYLHSLALTPQSVLNLTNIVLNLTNGVAQTNNILANSVIYYQVNVPTNADFATNSLLFALNGPLNVWFTTNSPPTLAGASPLFGGVTNNSVSILSTTSAPTNIVPGGTYYLGVQNTNSFTVNYGIEVDFHLTATNSTAQTNAVAISSIVATNGGFLLTWFAPSNELFQVQFATNLPPANWIQFTNIISYNTNAFTSPTNTQFNFFDNGVQYPFGPSRFYRLIRLSGALPANILTLPAQTNFTFSGLSPVTVTNTATDSNTNAILTYSLLVAPPNASISTNGIITWTNATPAGLAARFTTLVTDNGAPPASATNTFTIFVAPLPSITNVTVTATNVILNWSAPTNDQFNVRWATNLAPPIVWTRFPNNLSPYIITSTNGLFSFTDTNLPLVMKFYQLILLP